MTNPTFQELLTSQEARFTNEQLEAWAGLGPWLKQYSPTIDAMQIIETVERDSEGNVPIPRKIAHVYEGQRMDMDRIKLHSDALAAAPALAAALLAERKAREVEVGELKKEIRLCHMQIENAYKELGRATARVKAWEEIACLDPSSDSFKVVMSDDWVEQEQVKVQIPSVQKLTALLDELAQARQALKG